MEDTKIPQQINDFVGDNVKMLEQLFPSAVKDGQVDFNALKEELGQFEEVDKEKYELTWSGKQNAKKKAQEDVFNRTLRYIEADSKNPDTTENLYIEGDNLEVLKLLRQNYYGSIKMIYIDPPYNTGNDFVYNDNFNMDAKESDIAEGTVDEYGERLQKNQKSTNRYHANWLNMMYPRLKTAKDLLTEDGVIFISIDDHEAENLKKICDEVFGNVNYQATVSYVRKTSGKQDSTNFMKSTEFILVYSKSDSWDCSPIIATEKVTNRYNKIDSNGKLFRETDLRKTGNADRREDRPLMYYPFYFNSVNADLKVREKTDSELLAAGYVEIFPKKPDNSEGRWRWSYQTAYENIGILVARIMPKYKIENKYTVYEMDYIDKNGGLRTVKEHTSWDRKEFNSDNAMLEFKNLGFNNQLFPFPKSSALIKHMIYLSNCNNGFVLDFFSGSATTAHAVMKLNAEDGGNRKFIMVQVPEETDEKSEAKKAGFDNICEIGKERIRRAGEKIKEEIETANEQVKLDEEPKKVPDIGFKVFKTADTNIKWNLIDTKLGENINLEELKHTPDLADFMPDYNDIDVVYEVMLRQKDVALSEPLENLNDIGERTYLYGSAYLICLETEITEELIDKLSALNPLPIKFVFRDSAFKDDINLKDETFRRLKKLIEKNSGETKKTYTVEFI